MHTVFKTKYPNTQSSGSVSSLYAGYVTLSRVKSLDSLYIRFDKIKCNPKVIEFYKMLDYHFQIPPL